MNIPRIFDKLEEISARERDAIMAALIQTQRLTNQEEKAQMVNKIGNIVQATTRKQQCAASDRRTDAARRQLVGARVPQAMARRCKECAQARGVSLYRFVVDALEQACDNQGDQFTGGEEGKD